MMRLSLVRAPSTTRRGGVPRNKKPSNDDHTKDNRCFSLSLDFHWYPSHWFHTLRICITLKTPVFITDKLRVRFDACVLFYNAIYKGRPFLHVVRPNKNRTRVYLRPYVAGADGGMNRWRRERRHRRPRELTRLFYWHKHNLLPIR